jgi:adenylosuccinate synthase
LAVTLLDVLSGFETLKVCTQYDINGVLTKDFPTDVEILKDAKPVFEELPGWSEEITEIMSFDDLPLNARQYLARIAEVTETPICLAGVGRKRSQTIILDPDMMAM